MRRFKLLLIGLLAVSSLRGAVVSAGEVSEARPLRRVMVVGMWEDVHSRLLYTEIRPHDDGYIIEVYKFWDAYQLGVYKIPEPCQTTPPPPEQDLRQWEATRADACRAVTLTRIEHDRAVLASPEIGRLWTAVQDVPPKARDGRFQRYIGWDHDFFPYVVELVLADADGVSSHMAIVERAETKAGHSRGKDLPAIQALVGAVGQAKRAAVQPQWGTAQDDPQPAASVLWRIYESIPQPALQGQALELLARLEPDRVPADALTSPHWPIRHAAISAKLRTAQWDDALGALQGELKAPEPGARSSAMYGLRYIMGADADPYAAELLLAEKDPAVCHDVLAGLEMWCEVGDYFGGKQPSQGLLQALRKIAAPAPDQASGGPCRSPQKPSLDPYSIQDRARGLLECLEELGAR